MKEIGNGIGRAIYECNVPHDMVRDFRDQYKLEQWIKAKYERKKYINKAYKEKGSISKPKKEKARDTTMRGSTETQVDLFSHSTTVASTPSSTTTTDFFSQSSFTFDSQPNKSNMDNIEFTEFTGSGFSSTTSHNINNQPLTDKSSSLLDFGEPEKPRQKIDTQSILNLYSNQPQLYV